MSDRAAFGVVDDMSDVLVDVILGYECNVQCDYCSITPGMRLSNMSTKVVIEELARARALGMSRVAFGGGEPTIRRDLFPLVRYARDRGFASVKVSSNGLMYSYEDYVRQAIEAGITDFHVSVMAHTPELYRKILGHKEGLELVTRGVGNLVAAGHVPVLDLIVKDDTYMHLSDIIAYWAALGARMFPLWLVSLSDRNRDNVDSLPPVSLMRASLVAAFERGRELGVTVYSRHIPRCMLRGYEAFCRDLRDDRVLVVTPGSRFFLWESAISPNTYSPRCESCLYVRRECQGIRRDYLERHGDAEVVPYEGRDG
jgi:cyclic pyranopterin phosphate synthase